MVQRGKDISLPGMFAFPGGMHDPSDSCLRGAALRELFEETGVLPGPPTANCKSVSMEAMLQRRQAVHKDAKKYHDFVQEFQIDEKIHMMDHIATFVTPSFSKLRYVTPFFLKVVEEDMCSHIKADAKETAEITWISPSEAILLNSEGRMPYLPPQAYILHMLDQFDDVDEIVNGVRRHNGERRTAHIDVNESNVLAVRDARGMPAMEPFRIENAGDDLSCLPGFDDSATGKGHWTMCLPGDEHHDTYPGKAGTRHRMHCQLPMGKGYHLEENAGIMDMSRMLK